MPVLRVAYFPDSFHEVNGVAHTSRNFVAFAQRHNLPFLCVRAGNRGRPYEQTGELRTLELPRSRAAVRIEKDLEFDPLFFRHHDAIERELFRFRPDIIHITGPSELGAFGAYFARELNIPLAASWHTNVHEYAARRAATLTRRFFGRHAAATERTIESSSLNLTGRFYRLAQVLFAPNEELCRMLEDATRRPCHLMRRGVDTTLFSPDRRTRPPDDGRLVLGYVGRLSVEKNVALLPRIESELDQRDQELDQRDHELDQRKLPLETPLKFASRPAGLPPSNRPEFLIIGQGKEESTLRASLRTADFAGVLRGEALARAYADMDLLVFPSHTDTFGNVVLEALASGVPAIVTPGGGPKYIVRDGQTGFIVPDDDFSTAIATLAGNPARLAAMRIAARAYALDCSWDTVFHRVYAAYQSALPIRPAT